MSQIYLDHILQNKIVAIVRGIHPADVIKIAYALVKGGVNTMEVTLNSSGALSVIGELSKEMKNEMLIGAGTVLDAAVANAAIDAGACFIISPIVDEETIKTTKKRGAVSIPGAFTPTEIYKAFLMGGEIIKVFPASSNVTYDNYSCTFASSIISKVIDRCGLRYYSADPIYHSAMLPSW